MTLAEPQTGWGWETHCMANKPTQQDPAGVGGFCPVVLLAAHLAADGAQGGLAAETQHND